MKNSPKPLNHIDPTSSFGPSLPSFRQPSSSFRPESRNLINKQLRMGYVYILTNRHNLYVGVTSDLVRRINEHASGVGGRFTSKYNCHKLVHYEVYASIEAAISRETQLKWWCRDWKIELIERKNPGWLDLGKDLRGNPVLGDSGSSPE